MNEKLIEQVARAIRTKGYKIDNRWNVHSNDPVRFADEYAQAAIAAAFAFIREQAGREDVVDAAREAAGHASTETGADPDVAFILGAFDQIERTE